MQQQRLLFLGLQSFFLMVLAIGVLVFSGIRTVTFFSCTGWFTCGASVLPSISDQLGIFEWLHHWSIIAIAVLVPLLLILGIIVFRRNDEVVMVGIRNGAVLFFLQAVASIVTSLTSLLWQGPSIHFMTAALLLVIIIGFVSWAMFSPNQDFSTPILQGTLVVISVIPVVPYVSRFVS